MSQESAAPDKTLPQERSKKRSAEEAELEIDVNAPEPPSKKALRRAKKHATKKSELPAEEIAKTEEPDLKRLNGLESERSQYGVWIGNLAFTTGKKDLYNFLTNNAIPGEAITRLHLPSGDDNRTQNKGFAYVDFSSKETVEKAVQLSETLLGGRRLLIKDAKNFQGRPEKPKVEKPAQSRAPSRKIFVGNLDFETTVQDLEKHFGVCGPIMKTQMASFQDSGKCKGYAWIEFESLFAAEDAMKGWVEVERPMKGRDAKEETKTKKVWLHRMGDRKLRMEFAEDATTRYKKRYGGESQSASAEQQAGSEQQEPIVEIETGQQIHTSKPEKRYRDRPGSESRHERQHKRNVRPSRRTGTNSRYDEKTVQKLTGGIVEGKGSKVVFN